MDIYELEKIETPHLWIRPLQLGDESGINQAINRSLPELQRWMPWAQDPSLKATKVFVERMTTCWNKEDCQEFALVIIHKQDNQIIACSGYNEKSDRTVPFYEIGYWIDTAYQGQGLVTEWVNALTCFALNDLKAEYVQIATQAENLKSIGVAKRLNYQFDRTIKQDRVDCLTGEVVDSVLYVCRKAESLPPMNMTLFKKVL